jgi:hypothetical protein
VSEPLADNLGWDAGCERRSRVAVSDVMQSDLRQAGRPSVLLEPPGETLWVDGATVRPGEHQPRVLPARANRQPLLELPGAVLAERGDRHRVQRQRPATLGGLGHGDYDLIVDDHPRPTRRDAADLQIDIRPTESGDLAAPHTRGSQQQPRRIQRVTSHLIEEGTELPRTPDAHLWSHALRQVG